MSGLNLNISASLNVFKLIARPTLCLPQHTISTFADLPIPLDSAFKAAGRKADIRAVVLDKDDCFATPHSLEVYKPYKVSLRNSPCSPFAANTRDRSASKRSRRHTPGAGCS